MSAADPDHYSYTVYADPTTAESFDARRFGGPIGELVAGTQARVLLQMAGDVRGRRVLDVGTGTGRAAILLARAGAKVVGVDASEQMLAVARSRASTERLDLSFGAGDAHALKFGDGSFEVVVCLRLLMHLPDWRRAVGELCRVAANRVIVDYPSARSLATLESFGRSIVHVVRPRTEAYRVFTDGAVDAAFRACGFEVRSRRRQFVLPIALHKAINSRRFTDRSERWLDRMGLLTRIGSPVTIVAERCGS